MQIYLETKRLLLAVPDGKPDEDFRRKLLSDRKVIKYLPPLSEEQINNMIERVNKQWHEHNFGSCMMYLKETNEKIGVAGLKYYPPAGPNVVDIGCIITCEHQNKGYGTEVLAALTKHGFEFHKFDKISAIASEKNIRSIRVIEKLGYRRVKEQMKFKQDGVEFVGYMQFMAVNEKTRCRTD